jgi:hypothetical protein
MSKKPNIGGTVQISGKPYMVLSAPTRLGEWFSILVLQNEHPQTGITDTGDNPIWKPSATLT